MGDRSYSRCVFFQVSSNSNPEIRAFPHHIQRDHVLGICPDIGIKRMEIYQKDGLTCLRWLSKVLGIAKS